MKLPKRVWVVAGPWTRLFHVKQRKGFLRANLFYETNGTVVARSTMCNHLILNSHQLHFFPPSSVKKKRVFLCFSRSLFGICSHWIHLNVSSAPPNNLLAFFHKGCALLTLSPTVRLPSCASRQRDADMRPEKLRGSYLRGRIRTAHKTRLRKQIQQYHERSTSFQYRRRDFLHMSRNDESFPQKRTSLHTSKIKQLLSESVETEMAEGGTCCKTTARRCRTCVFPPLCLSAGEMSTAWHC